MKALKIISFATILLFALLSENLFALDATWEGNGVYEIGSGKEWFAITNLHTYDDVTVKMYQGGGVGWFWMYDNSTLIRYYDSSIAYLYLYDNTKASFFDGSSMDVYIDPASTAQVKLSAYDINFEPYDPYNDPLGPGTIHGCWLANDFAFSIDLVGQGAYSHVQIIPEPASAVIFALGTGWVASRRKRGRSDK